MRVMKISFDGIFIDTLFIFLLSLGQARWLVSEEGLCLGFRCDDSPCLVSFWILLFSGWMMDQRVGFLDEQNGGTDYYE